MSDDEDFIVDELPASRRKRRTAGGRLSAVGSSNRSCCSFRGANRRSTAQMWSLGAQASRARAAVGHPVAVWHQSMSREGFIRHETPVSKHQRWQAALWSYPKSNLSTCRDDRWSWGLG